MGSDKEDFEQEVVGNSASLSSKQGGRPPALATSSASIFDKSPRNRPQPSNLNRNHAFSDRNSTSIETRSVEEWLDKTLEPSSKKRKRPHSPRSTPSPLSHLSESLQDLEEISLDMPSTPSKKSLISRTGNLTPSVAEVKERLEQHGMYYEFKAKVQEILSGQRNSSPNPKALQKFEEMHEAVKLANEDTLWAISSPCSFQCLEASKSPLAPLDKWISDDYWDSGCIHAENVNFGGFFLPIDEDLVALMDKDKDKEVGMTNPRPDYVFGLRRLKNIVPVMYDSMLFIEGKSMDGVMGEAENQACRSGAALNNAARLLREQIGEPDVEGADDRTFVFSATVNPGYLEIWVNWAQVWYTEEEKIVKDQGSEGKAPASNKVERIKHVSYHMNLVASDAFTTPDFLKKYIRIFHNILDWGFGDRCKSNIEPFYDRLYAWQRKRLKEVSKELHQSSNDNTDGSRSSKRSREG
ncbi:hypothetical protein ACLMJK_006351 [Lecanora helva]